MAQNAEQLEELKKWLQRYYNSENYCADFFKKGRENYKLYKCYKEGGEKVYKHDIFVPYSFAFMEDMTASLMLSITASPIIFSLEPRVRAISPEVCQELEQIIQWAITDESCEFLLELEELIKNVNIFNAGYLVNYPILSGGTNNFQRMNFDTPSTLDVYPEPNIKRLSRMNWVIKKSWETVDALKEGQKNGEYKDVDESMGGYSDDDEVTKLLRDVGISTVGNYFDEKKQLVELLDCMFDGQVVTIGGRRAVIRDTRKNEIKPFSDKFPMLDCRMTGAPGEFFGLGLLESIKPLQKELNTLRSQRRDNISLILNKLWVYDILAGEVDLSTLYSAPGNVIVTTNQDALKELPVTDVTGSSYKEESSLQYDMQNVSNMWDYCFLNEDFDILTETGWKKFSETTLQDKIATRSPSGEIEYRNPTEKIVSPPLPFDSYEIDSPHIAGTFTGNHRFPVRGRRRILRINLRGPKFKSFVQVKDIEGNYYYRTPITASWNCSDLEYHEIPYCPAGNKNYPTLKIAIEDWLAFLGIFLAEGWTGNRDNKGNYEIGISQADGTKKDKIRTLLARLPWSFGEDPHAFRLSNKQLWYELHPLGGAKAKFIPKYIKELSGSKLRILLEWMMIGDGNEFFANGKHLTRVYYTASKRLADDFQEALIKSGLNANITVKMNPTGQLFKLVWKKTKMAPLGMMRYLGKKIGQAKCFVLPNETFMVRINGKAFWTGNSRGATPRRRETASGIIRLQQAAQGRNEWTLRKIDSYVLQPACKRLLVYLREYLPRAEYEAIVGPGSRGDEFYALDIEQIKRFFQVQPMTESIQSLKEMNLNMFMQAFDRLIKMPMVNHVALIKQLLVKLGQKNIKEILPMLSQEGQSQVQEGVQQMNAQQAAMREMMMQQGQAGPSPTMSRGMPGEMPIPRVEEQF